MDNRPIGMFDSGVGGITVYKEVKNKLKNESIIYLGDTKRFPYGNKSKETIISLVKDNINFLVSQNVKAVVIACGTATSQALDEVAPLYNIPIIGIIDPTVKYITSSNKFHKIGIVATAGTIRSNSWERNLLNSNPKLEVINKACPLLAPMAEEGWIDNEVARLTIHEYMKDLKDVDALVLGCTHYPLFEKIFKSELKPEAEILNTGIMVANYLDKLLESGKLERNNSKNTQDKFYLTDAKCNFSDISSKFLGCNSIKVYEPYI